MTQQSIPLCPTCGQPASRDLADTDPGWECRNEACPEFGQPLSDDEVAGDEHDLRRFIDAQAAVYDHVVTELRAGRKTGHWMWFVFPQIAGLGRSPTAQHYAIASLDEARAYLDHPVLGRRLRESAEILTNLEGGTAEEIFGGIDAMKLRSSMTLFARAAPGEPLFGAVLDRYFDGVADAATDDRL
jgi:uncharacterized protein (DUF1810 family)